MKYWHAIFYWTTEWFFQTLEISSLELVCLVLKFTWKKIEMVTENQWIGSHDTPSRRPRKLLICSLLFTPVMLNWFKFKLLWPFKSIVLIQQLQFVCETSSCRRFFRILYVETRCMRYQEDHISSGAGKSVESINTATFMQSASVILWVELNFILVWVV